MKPTLPSLGADIWMVLHISPCSGIVHNMALPIMRCPYCFRMVKSNRMRTKHGVNYQKLPSKTRVDKVNELQIMSRLLLVCQATKVVWNADDDRKICPGTSLLSNCGHASTPDWPLHIGACAEGDTWQLSPFVCLHSAALAAYVTHNKYPDMLGHIQHEEQIRHAWIMSDNMAH